MKKIDRPVWTRSLITVATIVGVMLIVGVFYFAVDSTKEPIRERHIKLATFKTLTVDGLRRNYLSYVPPELPANSPLMIVFHGSQQNAQSIRAATGYEFEDLALAHKFAIAYPNGYRGNWNDCRVDVHFAAHRRHVNDLAFVQAIIHQYVVADHIDPTKVMAVGYSNGGQMVYRLALETPHQVAAIAVIAASLPAPNNNRCQPSGVAMPTLIMNGTADPFNPYNGGTVRFFGLNPRGNVLSTRQTAAYFAGINGQTIPPVITNLPHRPSSGKTSVTLTDYRQPGKDEVALYTINGGGHVIPQSVHRPPRLLGPMTHDVDAPQVIWQFFSRSLHLS